MPNSVGNFFAKYGKNQVSLLSGAIITFTKDRKKFPTRAAKNVDKMVQILSQMQQMSQGFILP
jgi:hypothetical protein